MLCNFGFNQSISDWTRVEDKLASVARYHYASSHLVTIDHFPSCFLVLSTLWVSATPFSIFVIWSRSSPLQCEDPRLCAFGQVHDEEVIRMCEVPATLLLLPKAERVHHSAWLTPVKLSLLGELLERSQSQMSFESPYSTGLHRQLFALGAGVSSCASNLVVTLETLS